MYKRILLTSFVCLLLCGCVHYEVKQNHDPLHEFGESNTEIMKKDQYSYAIHSMICEIDAINQKTKTLIHKVKKAFIKKAKETKQYAQLNIDWHSYVKDHRYLSIVYQIEEMIGANKHQMIKTIHYDLKKASFFQLNDVLHEDEFIKMTYLVKEQLSNRYPEQSNTPSFFIQMTSLPQNFINFALKKNELVLYFNKNELYQFPVIAKVDYKNLNDRIKKEVIQTIVPYQDVLNEPIRNVDEKKPMVALTFDDGPNPRYTSAILDILKEEQACATFFILGNRASLAPKLLQRMILEGNEIGNHTFSHKQLTTLNKEQIEEEIVKTQNQIQAIIGKTPVLLRPPYGSHNALVDTCMRKAGMKFVSWSLDTQDWKHRDAKIISKKVLNEVRDGDIILMHDMYPSTVEATKVIITSLKENGYQFVTVRELLQYRTMPIAHG